jgi:predicted nucleic acid-binding protein
MPATFVVDASVVVEFLAPGEMGDEADRFMGGLTWPEPVALLAPDLLFLEVASALDRLARGGHLAPEAADRAVRHLSALPIGAVPSSGLLEETWSLRGNVTVYDGAYAALARGLDAPLVTADRRLVRAARAAGVTAWALRDRELGAVLTSLGPRP